ncbi:hypothetical protein D3C77_721410 [compost metagenome]
MKKVSAIGLTVSCSFAGFWFEGTELFDGAASVPHPASKAVDSSNVNPRLISLLCFICTASFHLLLN